MVLGWNEIKERAVKFSFEWADACNEEADAQNFLIDFFRKGTIVTGMKSRGKNPDNACHQAIDYLHGIKQAKLPRYLLVSDFETLSLYDLDSPNPDENVVVEFKLRDFAKHVHLFGFIAGYPKIAFKKLDPVKIKAAYLMGKLHDVLKETVYRGHELEKYLVRILLCLFAGDTSIFEQRLFQEYIIGKTNEDGSDLGMQPAQIFKVMNTPLECCTLDWSQISPAIFGPVFQSVMDATRRRNLCTPYTSGLNILKLTKPLFLDKLWKDLN